MAAKRIHQIPGLEEVKKALDYNLETGTFIWKVRPIEHFPNKRAQNSWNAKFAGKPAGSHDNLGYLSITLFKIAYEAHRLAIYIVTRQWPPNEIDHRNCNPSDNTFANLRPATRLQNGKNRKKSRNNTSGYKGVSFDRKNNNWRAGIEVSGRAYNLGRFCSPEEAHASYCDAARRLHGEFSRTD